MYIDGAWLEAVSGKTFEVLNPADGSVIASVPDGDAGDARQAIEAADSAFDG